MDKKYKINFINLEIRKDRLEHMNNEFKDLGIFELKRFEAIYDIKNGNHGCAKSYLKLISEAKEQNLDMTIICEDDIIITNKDIVESRFIGIMEWLTNNMDKWDIFNGGNINYGMYKDEKDKLFVKKNNQISKKMIFSRANLYYEKKLFHKMLFEDELKEK
jgi:GR25 family glycosyltransferase involved in LPS biosynthesis